MARYFARSIRNAVVLSVTCSAVMVHSFSNAAEEQLWKNVQSAGVLRCGAAVAAPYVMRDPMTSEYSGFFSDLCRNFGEKILKVKVEFVDTNWDNLIAGLQSKKWDLAMGLNETPERAMAIAFSAPAADDQTTLLINKDNPKFAAAGNRIQDYDKEGVNIVVMAGTSQEKAISAVVKKATILRLPGLDETRLAVITRRGDIIADSSDTNRMFAAANKDWAREIKLDPPLAKQGVSFGLRRDVSPADLQVLNIFITQLREAGEIDKAINAATVAEVSSK
ncbi:transporter substrate-binding domain-containing protein [Pseudomonas sp. Z1-14]|uniref:substrate-binding periplasmic protein n=1 Tax=Pseudomonas sp. Z1-14 TaxID=2817409 RepID=UPI003DA86073